MLQEYPFYLAGEFVRSSMPLNIINPYTGSAIGTTFLAERTHVETAIRKGLAAEYAIRRLPTFARGNALMKIASGMQTRAQEFAETITQETAKPIAYARAEVERSIQTFIDGAEECKRIYGQWMALDRHPSGAGHEAVVRRFPIGLVSAIAPFNFPLNLVAHKIAPAIAAGCPIILKPASKTPISALLLAELVRAADLPDAAVSILPTDRSTGDILVTDERFKLLTFTGSPDIGWDMKARAGKKKVVLELGGNAGLIVTPSADITLAVKKAAGGGFSFSGQSCIHTQRIYVHANIFNQFNTEFIAAARGLVYGDPMEQNIHISSMIDEKNAARAHAWVREAADQGATVLCGGQRVGICGYSPTILTDTRPGMKVCAEEVFAPIVIVERYRDLAEAIVEINSSRFGLQAGIFTNRLDEAHFAYESLEVGGVVVNDVPTFRADHMPYGGIKDSGLGREGVRYAIEDMTEIKTLVFNKL